MKMTRSRLFGREACRQQRTTSSLTVVDSITQWRHLASESDKLLTDDRLSSKRFSLLLLPLLASPAGSSCQIPLCRLRGELLTAADSGSPTPYELT